MDLTYSDEDGFENYIPTTTDPGPWLFGGTALYSVGCFVMIPVLVTIKKKSDNKRKSARLRSGGEGAEENNGSPPALVGCADLEMRPTKSTDEDVDCDEVVIQVTGSHDESLLASKSRTGRMAMDVETPSELMSESSAAAEIENDAHNLSSAEPSNAEQFQMSIDDGGSSNLQGGEEKAEIDEARENSSILTKQGDEVDEPFALEGQSDVNEVAAMQNSQINNATIPALELSDQQSCCANVFGCTRQKFISCSKDIVKHDKETKRILRLAGPFVMSEVSEVLFEALTVLLVSRYTDVDQLSAYIVTDLLIGTSETLIQGFLETLETVCSHAVGYGNNKLAGQYVQMVATLYTIFSIPIFGMWWFVMGPALRWFGLNAAAVDIGVRYTKLLIFDYLIEGIFEAVGAIPDVTGKERVTNIYQVTHEVIEFAVVWILFAKIEEFDLFWMGVLHLGSALIGFVGFTAVTVKLGWFDPYWEGLTKSFALKNKSAVKYVMKMALPLSIGALFEYGEWELLTIFAASMGQAELAAWGLMESIWDLLEAFAEGFANAGEVRVALQLGRGNIRQAKRSAWKSLFLVTILGFVITILYGVTGEYIVVLYTSDETLQEMLKAMVPIVAFGNVFQAFGSMAWALVGGQGRYHHATIVSSTITTSVSIPLAAFFSLAMDFPLESLVAALVIGYSTVSMCLSYLLITSDWKFISDKIMDEMDDDSSSSSSSEDDSSSSSSDETSGNGEVELVINQENEEESKPYQSSPSLPRSLNSSLIESDYCAGEDTTAESMIIVNIQPQDDTNDQSSVEVSITHQHSMSSSSQSSSSLSREGLAGKPVEHLAVSTAGVSTIPNMKVDLQINGIASIPASPKADEFERGVSSSYLFSPSSSSASSSSFPDMNAKVAFQLQPRIDHEKSNNEGIANGGDSSYAVAEAINASSEAAIIDADDTMTQQNDQLDVYSTPPSTPSREKLHPSSPFHSSSSVSNTRRNVVDTIMEEKDPHEVFSTPLSFPKS